MSRKNFSPAAWAMPQPVSIIGTYDEDGNPDAMNAAWTGQYDANQLVLCLSAGHKTTKNIMARKCFTLSFATEEQLIPCDYVGIVSGNTEKNKIKNTGWTVRQAEKVNAPCFEELPMTLECELAGQTENGNLIGNIVNISVDEQYLSDKGIPDVVRMGLVTFNPIERNYLIVGESVGNAWGEGKKLMK